MDQKLTDWRRILVGEAPVEFLLEVFLRTIIIYLILLIILRFMGKRMTGQLSISEMAVMITLGAIIAPTMQIPDRGILMGIIILLTALSFYKGINLWGFYNSKVETIVQGEESVLIADGVVQVEAMERARVSRQQLYSALRNENIYNLGEIERAYLEACGLISVYRFDEPRPGLPIFPSPDKDIQEENKPSDIVIFICENCGQNAEEQVEGRECSNCHEHKWIKA